MNHRGRMVNKGVTSSQQYQGVNVHLVLSDIAQSPPRGRSDRRYLLKKAPCPPESEGNYSSHQHPLHRAEKARAIPQPLDQQILSLIGIMICSPGLFSAGIHPGNFGYTR